MDPTNGALEEGFTCNYMGIFVLVHGSFGECIPYIELDVCNVCVILSWLSTTIQNSILIHNMRVVPSNYLSFVKLQGDDLKQSLDIQNPPVIPGE